MEPIFHLLGAGEAAAPTAPETGRITATRDVFLDADGHPWSYRGVSAFLLFYRWLCGEDVGPVCDWCISLGANVVRVLGMVGWKGQEFGPTITPTWWAELPRFLDYLAARGLRIELVVFADAQLVMPLQDEQRAHLRRLHDEHGGRWNVLLEVCNEPWQNGCDPPAVWSASEPRKCPMAYGMYNFAVTQDAGGLWIATLPVLSYLTAHSPRDPDAWSRKAKDLAEYRDGSGDGLSENAPLNAGLHVAPVGDEPMGAAEADQCAGRQRSNIAADFFWYHANAHINGAGSTFHCDAGLQAVLPPPGGDQQRCAEAAALAWAHIPPEFQTGKYTRGGLADLPLVWEPEKFPEQTSRIYARILGDRAVAVAIKPASTWKPVPVSGWTIVETVGPMNSLVHLAR